LGIPEHNAYATAVPVHYERRNQAVPPTGIQLELHKGAGGQSHRLDLQVHAVGGQVAGAAAVETPVSIADMDPDVDGMPGAISAFYAHGVLRLSSFFSSAMLVANRDGMVPN